MEKTPKGDPVGLDKSLFLNEIHPKTCKSETVLVFGRPVSVPQFPSAPPEDPVEDTPSEQWNKKWMDPGYYHLSEEEEREIERQRVRKRHKHDMHPTVRS